MRFENEHVRAKSRARPAAPLSDNGPVQSTVRQDQRVRVRVGQQTVPERMRNETGELRVSQPFLFTLCASGRRPPLAARLVRAKSETNTPARPPKTTEPVRARDKIQAYNSLAYGPMFSPETRIFGQTS